MAQYNVTLEEEKIKELLIHDQGLKALVETVVNQVLEAQLTDQIRAEKYERTEGRKAYRNGYRDRRLSTRVGKLVLRIPQTREGTFSPELFRRYQRNEQALVLAMMEMVLQGVSTRKVTKITEELCGTSYSKSTVSQLCKALDLKVKAWNERRLEGEEYPFLIVDAIVIKVRRDEAVRPTSGLIVCGVNRNGTREVLGLQLGDSETEATWRGLFQWLKRRGLRGVDFVVSDAHKGLIRAIQRSFQGAVWQRCQVHLLRNVLGHTPRHVRGLMAHGMQKIFRADNKAEARRGYEELEQKLEGKAQRALEILEDGLEDALAVLILPEKYRVRLRTTNMVERRIEEIRRRERVIRIFPNEDSAHRMLGALMAELHEEWSTGKRYFNMTEYWEWKASHEEIFDNKLVSIVESTI
jgi:putative transposase